MRSRTALACVALGLLAGAGAGVGLRTALPSSSVSPARPVPTSTATTAARPNSTGPTSAGSTRTGTPTGNPKGSVGRDDLVSVSELESAGWHGAGISTTVSSDEVDPIVSPCQRPGPFTGLDPVVGRWQDRGGRAGEVAAEASSVAEARRRANEAYEQHLHCAELSGRSVGARHAVTVDGGSITWFEVTEAGRSGLSAVVRQSDRFAVVYADASQVPVARLPDLLRDAATRLR